MKKLLLTCIIIASAASLHGMEAPKKLSPIALPQIYHYFAKNMNADIARHILSLQIRESGIDLETFETSLKDACKHPGEFMTFVEESLAKFGYNLTFALCKQSLNQAKLSICDIKDKESGVLLHYVGIRNPMLVKTFLELAGDKVWTLLTRRDTVCGYAIPLHVVVRDGLTQTVKLLLDAAGDKAKTLLKYRTEFGSTPLDLAKRFNREEIIQLITEYSKRS